MLDDTLIINYLYATRKLITSQEGRNVQHILEIGVLMKLFRLIKGHLNETVKFCIVRCLCDAFRIQNAVKR